MNNRQRFRAHLADPKMLMVPIAHDPLCARIIERAGFQAVGVGGAASAAALLGRPDGRLLSAREMADVVWRTVDAVRVPVFADADDGYGDATHVAWTVRQYESAGAAGLFLADRPARRQRRRTVGAAEGDTVVPAAELIGRIEAAVAARRDPDMLIMARTDALAVHGIDEALGRAHGCVDAGADAICVANPASTDQMRRITEEITARRGIPTMADTNPGVTPPPTAAELQEIGYSLTLYPTLASRALARAVAEVMGELSWSGDAAPLADRLAPVEEFHALAGPPEHRPAGGPPGARR
ncbi:isocitrate lyase/phosphoenolpyruvate mutase family protein [Streptomyces netropsis]|uniref:Methylisocitrate lyase n=1 Tax=Streptomyces netropsis TaxID=55404 RepID=A0A7W7PDQ4_STRNE|nr:isocitrate lyase/phosphoenolpyruvate mutase family protein [Streptomyces netropsis]MBB4885363.1 methylisocitrate lyase [Streptomyces netropsis]GGR37678.1 isocitrate lyase-family enzyme [Streptomyces netropsis]